MNFLVMFDMWVVGFKLLLVYFQFEKIFYGLMTTYLRQNGTIELL